MANTMRWRYGETNPVMAPVHEAIEIEIGDLLYLDGPLAWPASHQDDEGSELSNQAVFHDRFLGVAMQASGVGESEPIRVATTGVFEYESVLNVHGVGDLIGVGEKTSGAGLDNQRVAAAPNAPSAIGRSAAYVNPPSERVLVDLVSSVMRGGVQAIL